MKLFKKCLAILVVLLAGCQAVVYGTASDFEKISLGMSKAQVIEALGSPVSVSADGDKGEEYLIYKRMKHAISEWPRTYAVTLREGKVVKYGEQYEEKNINKY
ncbi:MAG: outer membrane protein assembly factor BamE [Hydrogenophaga sp.]|nr:outer membrane protein assembly factor BamE [Hydrogenophaga sp.]